MAHKILGALLIVALIAILLTSDRGWVLGSRSTVADVGAIPNGPGEIQSHLEQIVDEYGVHSVHARTNAETLYYILVAAGRMPAPPPNDGHVVERPRYGYSIVEYSLFGMPFGWSTEDGYTLYTNDRWELVTGKPTDTALAQLTKEIGHDPAQGFFFPFWAHAWGWAYLAAIGLWGWLYHRAIVRRREALGMI
jgi:hypothetical protein